MPAVNKLSMIAIAVKDMPKMTNFYADQLGLEVTQDYRQDEKNWWVNMTMPEGGVAITLGLEEKGVQPGTLTIYLTTKDIEAAHKELEEKGVKVSDVQDDLYGPGSGVKFMSMEDPEGNTVIVFKD